MNFSFPGYLKLWQLQIPKPQLSDQYDVLFIDEAQDCTPGNDAVTSSYGVEDLFILLNFVTVMASSVLPSVPAIMDVLLSQRCGKILVGDPHQQIYTFKGAVNALNIADHTHIYYLTQVYAITHTKGGNLCTEAAEAFKL